MGTARMHTNTHNNNNNNNNRRQINTNVQTQNSMICDIVVCCLFIEMPAL